MNPRREKRFLFSLASPSRLPCEDHKTTFHFRHLSLTLSLFLFFSHFSRFISPTALSYFSIPPHSVRPLVHDPRNKDPEEERNREREREEMGRNAHIERKLLATAGESSWQIPGMLVEITFDRLVIREKKKRRKTSLSSPSKEKFAR